MYIIFSSCVEFRATDELIQKLFTQVYYVSDFVDYTVYECIKHKNIMLFLKSLEYNKHKVTL